MQDVPSSLRQPLLSVLTDSTVPKGVPNTMIPFDRRTSLSTISFSAETVPLRFHTRLPLVDARVPHSKNRTMASPVLGRTRRARHRGTRTRTVTLLPVHSEYRWKTTTASEGRFVFRLRSRTASRVGRAPSLPASPPDGSLSIAACTTLSCAPIPSTLKTAAFVSVSVVAHNKCPPQSVAALTKSAQWNVARSFSNSFANYFARVAVLLTLPSFFVNAVNLTELRAFESRQKYLIAPGDLDGTLEAVIWFGRGSEVRIVEPRCTVWAGVKNGLGGVKP